MAQGRKRRRADSEQRRCGAARTKKPRKAGEGGAVWTGVSVVVMLFRAVLLLRILRSLDREVQNDGDHLRMDAAAGGQSDRT